MYQRESGDVLNRNVCSVRGGSAGPDEHEAGGGECETGCARVGVQSAGTPLTRRDTRRSRDWDIEPSSLWQRVGLFRRFLGPTSP